MTRSEEYETRESCGSCGADIEPSTVYPWHREDEDCRAVRGPLTVAQVIADLERYGKVAGWR